MSACRRRASAERCTPTTLFVHADHLDRPVRMTNASQALVWAAGRKLSRQSGADDVDLQAMSLRKNG
ncbi:hypothetical protein [Bosea vaviloviae]|uniref:hypothetical protein n=1 Tax=Bosea vaviloviae TaxID=1526658 RepID=UPI0011DFA384|nr:hypothetical protein [Bosea vaviloviae]